MTLIQIRNLLKRYDSKVAVDNISLEIEEGEIFGLLGPNGAGKSTTINMLCGLLPYDQGEIAIDQYDIKKQPLEIKKRIGYVPQEIAIFENLTAKENLEFFGKLAGLRGTLLKTRVNEALNFVGLDDKADLFPKSFSGGMKRRLNIACAIVHQPKIIIMDEPTVGIDPQSRNHILESVRKLNKLGATIIYTSHYMEEVEAICNRIAIIDHGKVIAKGTKEDLKQLVADDEKIILEVLQFDYNLLELIKSLNGVKEVEGNTNKIEVITNNAQLILQDILFLLAKESITIKGIKMVEPDLETVFLSLTGRKLRD